MKPAIIIILTVVAVIVAGYFGVPFLIDKHTSETRKEVQDLEQRLQKMEDEAKVAPLKTDADARQIIKTVNAISLKLNTMEDSFRKDVSAADESIKKQKTATEEALKKQNEIFEKSHKETRSEVHLINFYSAVSNIREHVLKARIEIIAKNIGNAKTELDLIDELFSGIIASAPEESKKTIIDLQVSLKRAKSEIDTDLPSAVNRINAMWHEISRVLRQA